MPQMGYDMVEGTLVRWIKSEGDEVKRGEPVAEIETDKAVVEMESTANGLLRKILATEGATVPVGHPIGIIGSADEDIAGLIVDEAQASGDAPSAEVAAEAASPAPASQTQPAADGERVKVSPVARKLAEEHGIELSQVKGTGPGGRITREDVLNFEPGPAASIESHAAPATPAAPTPVGEPVRVELSRMRQGIARATSQSKNGTPHFYITIEIDMTDAMALRSQVNQEFEGARRVSVNDMVLKATVESLKKHSGLNASYRGDYLETYPYIHLGMAIATEQGLMVPAIVNAQDKSLVDLAEATKDLAERAGQGRLRQEEYTGTFSTSNLGMFGVDEFSAIILPPQAATLAISAIKKRPVVVADDQVVVRQMMKVTLSIDHRVSDGVESAQFLAEAKRLLENPALLLVT